MARMQSAPARTRRTGHAWRPIVLGSIAVLAAGRLAAGQSLADEIRDILDGSPMSTAQVGVHVVDLATGETLASSDPATPRIPASNMKLLTSGAALSVLGPEFAFRTRLARQGDRLVLVGSGDPGLADPDLLARMSPPMTVDDLLGLLVRAVQQADMDRVAEIVVDDRIFDRERIHPGWPVDQLDHWYCAEVTGLNFHTNVLWFFASPSPAGPGALALVRVQPAARWMDVIVRARTVGTGRNALWVLRERGDAAFAVHGDVRLPATVPIRLATRQSELLLGRLLADRLIDAGVALGPADAPVSLAADALAVVRPATDADVWHDLTTLAVVTTSLEEVLRRCNTDSHNLYAEALLKRIAHEVTGRPGSWTDGAAIIRMLLRERLGPEFAAATIVADGSGMSRDNRIAPATLTRWLDVMQRDARASDLFLASLATPGTGTLQKRFRAAGPVNLLQAKSGYLEGVVALSGYLTHRDSGHRVAFSVLVNGVTPGEGTIAARKLQEDIALAIDRWLLEQHVAQSGAMGG